MSLGKWVYGYASLHLAAVRNIPESTRPFHLEKGFIRTLPSAIALFDKDTSRK
jgi:hypothetical protein